MNKAFTLIIFSIVSLTLNAQNNNQKEHSILTALIDENWTGEGILMGEEATFSMKWNRVLDSKFIKLDFQNKRKTNNDQDIVFRSTAYYQILKDTMIVGHWFDNRGISFQLNGVIKEDELTIFWGNEETEKGKTIYHYDGKKISVEDFILNEGKYAQFGSATYGQKNK